MLSKPTILLATVALAINLFSQGIIAAPHPLGDTDIEARSADTTPAGGLWQRSTIVLPRDAVPEPVAEADAEADADAGVGAADDDAKLVRRAQQANPSRWDGNGVKATCEWRWVNYRKVDQVKCTVRDTRCDSYNVYAYLRVYASEGNKKIGRVNNNSGCHAGSVKGAEASYRDNGWIRGARVIACVADPGPDSCYSGDYRDNPY